VTHGPPTDIERAFFEIYFPRRFAYFSLDPEPVTAGKASGIMAIFRLDKPA